MKLSFKFRRKQKEEEQVEEAAEPQVSAIAKTSKGAGIKRWLFLHGEKLATLAVLLILVLMVYSAIGKLELKRGQTPDDLKNLASQIRTRIDNAPFPADNFPIPDYSGYVIEKTEPIAATNYQIGSFTGDEQTTCRRSDPEIFPPQQLEVKAGHGVFFVTQRQEDLQGMVVSGGTLDEHPLTPELIGDLRGSAPPEGGQAEGRRWVAITALVPYQQQVDAYDGCFQLCLGYDPEEDWPKFAHVNVRRIEIVPGTEQDGEDAREWSLDESYLAKIGDSWAGRGTDPVPPEYQAPGLTQPLGPLANAAWNRWASHAHFDE
ncbi:MAG: hypothetical protein GTO03_03460, partial [Planctomycetales bacterium]|nr:hypothetical protein [Planctomycetales bacterium]